MFVLFRCKLEYASVVWCPEYQMQSNRIEMIQSKFLRAVTYRKTAEYPTFTPYVELLDIFNTVTLKSRRDLHAVIFCYKLFNHYIDSNELISFLVYLPIQSIWHIHYWHRSDGGT